MKKEVYIIALAPLSLIMLFMYFNVDEEVNFSSYETATSSIYIEKSKPKRALSSQKKVVAKGNAEEKLKTKQALIMYQKMKDLPSNLIPLGHQDLLENKFIPKKKINLAQQNPNYSLEVLPSHYYLNQKEKFYTIKIKTLYKEEPIDSNIEVIDQKNKLYSIERISTGFYQVQLNPQKMDIGKKYFSIYARTSKTEILTSLALQVNAHYFDYIRPIENGIEALGHLFFTNEFNIIEPGDYLLEGTLYYEDKPFVQASRLFKKLTGLTNLSLIFHGYLFYKKKVSGRFKLRGVQITKIGNNLESTGDSYIQLNQKTSAYSWSQFNPEPYENEVINQKIDILKQAQRN